jgi:hypothetical protein
LFSVRKKTGKKRINVYIKRKKREGERESEDIGMMRKFLDIFLRAHSCLSFRPVFFLTTILYPTK